MKKLLFVQRAQGRHWVGDGFPVRSIFSYNDISAEMSPFLLLDYAGPATFPPSQQRRGVGEHPHRGFETVTIVYSGEVEHRDSTGGGGIIGPGDVQWMTAGAGIVHQEYHGPEFSKKGGLFEVIQLWVNLPAKDKMTSPGYQAISRVDIPLVDLSAGVGTGRVIAGICNGTTGPAHSFTPMNLWDLRLNAGHRAELRIPNGHTAALLVLKGKLGAASGEYVDEAELAVFERNGELLAVDVLEDSAVLLLSGEPISEPVVGQGPFVMNTQSEIRQAIADYQSGRMGRIINSSEIGR